ncbi:MAG TPA: bifunctional riboflavin kinase/FAD synthetase [Chloroflexota bacterium]|nr:bifunctional riboflavin kinase/FAD synthetase [Chloroflexota bacterium]
MRVRHAPDALPPSVPPEVVATIGNFDGVHLGHRALLNCVTRRAAERGVQSAVVTFDPHPRRVLRPDAAFGLLSTLDERLSLFEALGVDHVLVWRFDDALRALEPEQFLDSLAHYVTLRLLVHGPGFALGRARRGTTDVLAELGRTRGFSLEEVALRSLTDSSDPITSTAVRTAVETGRVEDAERALGRAPALAGTVVEGEKIGRTLGFPTANLAFDVPLAVPADGVYAAWAELDPFTSRARRLPAAVSIGERPTFDGKRRVVEAYLLSFDGDLYGKTLRLHFVRRLRGQEKFDSVDALISQMRRDVAAVDAALRRAAARPAHQQSLLAP